MTDRDDLTTEGASRRSVLLGAGALGAAGILAACGDDTPTPPSQPPPAATPGPTTTGSNGGGSAIKVADIPVGGGKVFQEQRVVVTQPAAGDFKAFDATCQHMGCIVSSVSDAKINCACHGSQYNIADGSVARGPGNKPLPPKTVTVSGDSLTVT